MTPALRAYLRTLADGQPARLTLDLWREHLALAKEHGTAHAGHLLALYEETGTTEEVEEREPDMAPATLRLL